MTKHWVIIPAAGKGMRMGQPLPKQYLDVEGKTVLDHAIALFISSALIEKVIIAIASDDEYWPTSTYADHEKVHTVIGGAERNFSVFNAMNFLKTIASEQDFVLVHDAVRPCLRLNVLEKMIHRCKEHAVGGILAAPVRDTLKKSNDNNEIMLTVKREQLWHAQTPQMFRFPLLFTALKNVIEQNIAITDDAEAIELMGLKPLLIHGQNDNIKLTYPEDINLIRYILQQGT